MKRWFTVRWRPWCWWLRPRPAEETTTGGEDDGEETTLTVYAAASLTSTFEQIGEDFEADHDGVTVEFNFAGSSDLVSQIQRAHRPTCSPRRTRRTWRSSPPTG